MRHYLVTPSQLKSPRTTFKWPAKRALSICSISVETDGPVHGEKLDSHETSSLIMEAATRPRQRWSAADNDDSSRHRKLKY